MKNKKKLIIPRNGYFIKPSRRTEKFLPTHAAGLEGSEQSPYLTYRKNEGPQSLNSRVVGSLSRNKFFVRLMTKNR